MSVLAHSKGFLISLLATILLTSCTHSLSDVEQSYNLVYLNKYDYQDIFTGQNVELDFYKRFNDKNLIKVIELALDNNLDMQISYLNVQKARENLRLIMTDSNPTLQGNLNVAKNYDANSDLKVLNQSSQGLISISYQVDLFNKIGSMQGAYYQEYQASIYDYLAMRLSIIDSTSQAYFTYAYSKDSFNLAEQNLADSKKRLQIVQKKYEQGLIDKVELDMAKINHLTVLGIYKQKLNQLDLAKNALIKLLGKKGFESFSISSLYDISNLSIALDFPSRLLTRRPDLMALSARVNKAFYNIDTANASFFPEFTISSSLQGGSSESIGRFLQNPIAALAGSISLPFLNYNKLSIEKKIAVLDKDIASVAFVQGYLNALKEVQDCISNYYYASQLVKSSMQKYMLSYANYKKQLERYKYGLISLSDLLDASDTYRSSADEYLTYKMNVNIYAMNLMIALGGDTNDNSLNNMIKITY